MKITNKIKAVLTLKSLDGKTTKSLLGDKSITFTPSEYTLYKKSCELFQKINWVTISKAEVIKKGAKTPVEPKKVVEAKAPVEPKKVVEDKEPVSSLGMELGSKEVKEAEKKSKKKTTRTKATRKKVTRRKKA